jgi:hypothetical protein
MLSCVAYRDAAEVPQERGAGHEQLPQGEQRPGVQLGGHVKEAEDAAVRGTADAGLDLGGFMTGSCEACVQLGQRSARLLTPLRRSIST